MKVFKYILLCLTSCGAMSGYAQNAKNKVVEKDSLLSKTQEIGEVVVTAQESRGLSAASVIEKHAMEHLQPSCFSDILELLPGFEFPQYHTPS